MSILTMKQCTRKAILAQREQLSADTHGAHSVTIIGRLLQLPAYRQAGTVLGYMNFGSEFASELWVERALAEGKRLALPKINHHTNRLDLYWVDDPENQLTAGLWGIREPVVERCEKLVAPEVVEFVLLPGVAFTRCGARLGYGGGYYDKLLAGMAQRPILAAAAFALQIADSLPQEATDVRIDWIVTERETIDCTAQGRIK